MDAPGDIRALARAITRVENGQDSDPPPDGYSRRALVVGFTGAPGVGKSTLISAFAAELRSSGRTVAVLSVDPSSPFSGGAILGDRLRMGQHATDSGVFIRSVASRGHLGGLCRQMGRIITLVDRAGWDVIVLETVGTGQSEVEIADIADVNVVLLSPGMGDDIQAMKSGILEIADILVVNKSDLPGASRTVRELQSMLALRSAGRGDVPVLQCSASQGEGVSEILATVDTLGGTIPGTAESAERLA